MLQLSGHPVAKCDLQNGRATQIFQTTAPTGDPIIYVAKVCVRSSNQYCHVGCVIIKKVSFFQYFLSGNPAYQLGGSLGDPGVFVGCSAGDVSSPSYLYDIKPYINKTFNDIHTDMYGPWIYIYITYTLHSTTNITEKVIIVL